VIRGKFDHHKVKIKEAVNIEGLLSGEHIRHARNNVLALVRIQHRKGIVQNVAVWKVSIPKKGLELFSRWSAP
jgi:hypothetical protein